VTLLAPVAAALPGAAGAQSGRLPWYLRTYRWGQTNITERDPTRYDIAWWREHWRRTRVQGVIINAGGIVAYYPSKFPLHYRAQFLGGRDLFRELAKAAHDDGLVVMDRMDSNRTAEDFYRAHPDWFALDVQGRPYRAADKYLACINSPYYDEYLPGVLREIVERSRPEGITDNSWAGQGRDSICYCPHCERKFHAKTGQAIPRRADWDDPAYRRWILWSYERRLEVWDLNNRATQAGGPDCIWSGLNSGSVSSQARSFRDGATPAATSPWGTCSAPTTGASASPTPPGAARPRDPITPICVLPRRCAPASTAPRPAMSPRPPASATLSCAASRKPISSPSAACSNLWRALPVKACPSPRNASKAYRQSRTSGDIRSHSSRNE